MTLLKCELINHPRVNKVLDPTFWAHFDKSSNMTWP